MRLANRRHLTAMRYLRRASLLENPANILVNLGGMDESDPVPGVGPVDFQTVEYALDTVALLVERPVMFKFHAAA